LIPINGADGGTALVTIANTANTTTNMTLYIYRILIMVYIIINMVVYSISNKYKYKYYDPINSIQVNEAYFYELQMLSIIIRQEPH